MELSIDFNKTSIGVSFTFSQTQLKQKNKLGKTGEVKLHFNQSTNKMSKFVYSKQHELCKCV